ncbi:cytidine deaminase-like protein [Polychytrium aggregatum]|uniref:cytidine deaminase-like protein n=1 Tax=Polychytrium aggregatum TaxID=110093 RepID=UPI0022FDE00E|nr:cytidine deaminase-like protein [Polychytrium aggregatum]KAI9207647.1 cytidine deaminase-like protein [Polychytrium aggregatum]
MIVGLVGPPKSGKTAVASFLLKHLGFCQISLATQQDGLPAIEDDAHIVVATAEALMDHITQNWTHNFVLDGIESLSLIETLSIRPFFLLVSVDSPISMRLARQLPDPMQHRDPGQLLQFMSQDDDWKFGKTNGKECMERSALKIVNAETLASLYAQLQRLDITNPIRLRPSWDTYFMKLCNLAATRSNCMKRRVGCILVRNNRIIATGYNGTPRGVRNCNEGGCDRCNHGASNHSLDTCLCLHAEENALLEAGRERVDSGVGHAILYCNTCPCLGCAKKIIQVGIREVIYALGYKMDDMTAKLFDSAGVQLRQHVVAP